MNSGNALNHIFRKHEIFRMNFKLANIHLSKLLNFIFIKCHKLTFWKYPPTIFGYQSKKSAIDYQCIGFSHSSHFPSISYGEKVLMFLIIRSFHGEISE